ncbi:MAG: hypothetical protein PHX70_06475 [Clostridium sp.]|nr:hypothetical protein [Clostridium sp.]
MAVKMETNEVAKFRQLIDQISETIKNRMNDLKYLIDNFNQVSSSIKDSLATYKPYTKEAKVGGGIAKILILGALGLDLENTWSDNSGNIIGEKFMKKFRANYQVYILCLIAFLGVGYLFKYELHSNIDLILYIALLLFDIYGLINAIFSYTGIDNKGIVSKMLI